MKTSLLTILLGLAVAGTAHAGIVFQQDGSTTWGTGSFGSGNLGTNATVTGSNPLTLSKTNADSNVRFYTNQNAGLGQLDSYSGGISWSFDYSVVDMSGSNNLHTWNIAIAAQNGIMDQGGSEYNNAYLFGTAFDGSLVFGYSNSGGKEGAGGGSAGAVLYNTGLLASSGSAGSPVSGSGSAVITFDGVDTWTVSGSFDGSAFNSGPIVDTTYTNIAMDYINAGSRNWNEGASLSLSDMTVTAIPEPSTYALLAALGALGFVMVRRRRA